MPSEPITLPSQPANQPRFSGAQSPETLPRKGYTSDQLSEYIERQLGKPVWTVELTRQQVLDCVYDALSMYSQWRPIIRLGAVKMVRGVTRYLEGVDVGQGVAQVDFVESRPAPTEIFYGNLISPAPILSRGIDDYDTFLRWRKTWLRVTSVAPDWWYDSVERVLCIHNPIERYTAGVYCYYSYDDTTCLDDFGATWVKDYALEKSRYLHGEIFAKFGGAIPGPARDISLDSGRRDKAEAKMAQLEEKLRGAQITTPAMID